MIQENRKYATQDLGLIRQQDRLRGDSTVRIIGECSGLPQRTINRLLLPSRVRRKIQET